MRRLEAFKDTAGELLNTFFVKEWKTPARGNKVPNREWILFSGGGIGVKTLYGMTTWVQMSATCLLMGTVYGLGPRNLLILFIISSVISIVKTPLASWIMDNTRTKMGKFRPYMLWAGLPCLVGVLGLVFAVPVNGTVVEKMIAIAVFYNIYLISQQIYFSAYTGITQVISTNTGERNKILSISDFISSLGPSIVQLFMPIFAQALFGKEALNYLITYRIFLPIFASLGFVLGLVVMFSTKERAILPEKIKEKVKFWEAFKAVCSNRDFWIVSFSRLTNTFKTTTTILLPWICLYQLNNSAMLGVLNTIVSFAYVPGMLLAPLLMKKIGNGKSAFIAYALNAVMAALMLVTFKKGVAFFVIGLFLYNFALGPQFTMQTSITADALDEIQLKTGKRYEGFAQNFQLMFEIIGGIIGQVVLTFVYEHFGLIADSVTGLVDYKALLPNPEIREPIVAWVCIISIIISATVAIPFLFSKMNHKKHEVIIEELEKRKFFTDNKYEKDENGLITEIPVPESELEARYVEFVIKTEIERKAFEKEDYSELKKFRLPKFSGDDIYRMLHAGLDINSMSNREMKKWLKNN